MKMKDLAQKTMLSAALLAGNGAVMAEGANIGPQTFAKSCRPHKNTLTCQTQDTRAFAAYLLGCPKGSLNTAKASCLGGDIIHTSSMPDAKDFKDGEGFAEALTLWKKKNKKMLIWNKWRAMNPDVSAFSKIVIDQPITEAMSQDFAIAMRRLLDNQNTNVETEGVPPENFSLVIDGKSVDISSITPTDIDEIIDRYGLNPETFILTEIVDFKITGLSTEQIFQGLQQMQRIEKAGFPDTSLVQNNESSRFSFLSKAFASDESADPKITGPIDKSKMESIKLEELLSALPQKPSILLVLLGSLTLLIRKRYALKGFMEGLKNNKRRAIK